MKSLKYMFWLVVLLALAACGRDVAPDTLKAANAASPTITSDKEDYAPGELVTLTGSNWQPGESVHINVDDDQTKTWVRNVNVTADENGDITDKFNLPDWFVATYQVVATGQVSGVAKTSFTDGNVTYSKDRVPDSGHQSVQAGQSWDFSMILDKKGGGSDPTVNTPFVVNNPTGDNKTPATCGKAETAIPASWLSVVSPSLPRAISSATSFTFRVSPVAGASGTYTGRVSLTTTDGGSQTFDLCLNVTAANNPAPTLTSISPTSTTQGNTLDVELTGSNFGSFSSVSFGSNITVNSTAVNSTKDKITASITVGAGAATGARNVSVTNAAPGGGTATLTDGFTVNAACTPASITTQPGSPQVTYGANATFEAAASGRPAPTVQWQARANSGADWSNVSEATNTTLTVSKPSVAQSGSQYRAIFTNTCNGTQTASSSVADLTVTAKSVNGSFRASDKEYDGGPSATVTDRSLSGVLAADEGKVSLSGGTARFDNASVANNKTVTLAGASLAGDAASNYSLSSMNTTTANITPKSLTGSFTAEDKVYDGNVDATVANYTLNGVISGDEVALRVEGAQFDNKNVGNGKTVTVNTSDLEGTHASNYTLAGRAWTTTANITPRPITVTAVAKSKIYGDADPALTFSGELQNDDSFTGSLSRVSGETVADSPYAIQQGTLSAGDNYDLSFTGANLTITKRNASVSPTAASKTYSDADPTLIGTLDGFVAADNVSASYSRSAGETVAGSPYTISATLSPAGVLDNYDVTYNTANFTINRAPMTVTADNASRLYGVANPTFTGTITGIKNSDNITATYSTTATQTSIAGTYSITPSLSGAALGNYNVTSNNGTLTITPWTFTGFFSPVDMNNVFNVAKAGSAIPVKFKLGGDYGLGVISKIASYKVACPSTIQQDTLEETASGTTSGLKYDASVDQYNYTWKTATSLAGTCQRLEMQLIDGSTAKIAYFKFTK